LPDGRQVGAEVNMEMLEKVTVKKKEFKV